MLLVICGPSGVGKSAVITVLARRCGWERIPTYMTRSVRPGETEKVQVPHGALDDCEEFFCVNEYFGNRYGTMKADVERAATSEQVWMLDFPLENRALLESVPHLCAILIPEDETQLLRQLSQSDRSERRDEALGQLRTTYRGLEPGPFEDGAIVIRNRYGRLDDSADHIESFVLRSPRYGLR